ncbi:MAG: glycosyltransferase family 2 protein [Candidatus Moraniibacteriota bacterium]|nr:MAG: glycosyltransferase family 2 protein [Candidatus Moranbacteria bacterium]
MKTYIVVPAYNESRYLARFLDKLTKATKNIIVVDDGSRDDTTVIAKEYGVTTLTHLTNLGKGAALKTGCEYAFSKKGADAVVIMDGDDQHDATDLPKFKNALSQGAEVVLGIRSMDNRIPFGRLLGNRLLSSLIYLLFGRYIPDIPSGYKALTKLAYQKLVWNSSGYEVESELAVRLAKSKIAYATVPITTHYHGKEYGFNLLDAFAILIKIPFWIWS